MVAAATKSRGCGDCGCGRCELRGTSRRTQKVAIETFAASDAKNPVISATEWLRALSLPPAVAAFRKVIHVWENPIRGRCKVCSTEVYMTEVWPSLGVGQRRGVILRGA